MIVWKSSLWIGICFKELHNDQEYYWPTTYRAREAVVSTITSSSMVGSENNLFCFVRRIQPAHWEVSEIEMANPEGLFQHPQLTWRCESCWPCSEKAWQEPWQSNAGEPLEAYDKAFPWGPSGNGAHNSQTPTERVVAQHGQADWTGYPGLSSLPAGWTKM